MSYNNEKDFGETKLSTERKNFNFNDDVGDCECYLVNLKTNEKTIIAKFPFIIGRSVDCMLTLKNDVKISRIHCVITKTDKVFILEDLGSRNGTLVNEKPIHKTIISDGCKISIGNFNFKFVRNK